MVEILLSLAGVVIGGEIGLGGTYLQTKNQQKIRRREEIVPVASRVLALAGETYLALTEYVTINKINEYPDYAKKFKIEMAGPGTAKHYMLLYQKLKIALDELSLLMPGIENETEQLLKSLDAKQLGTVMTWTEEDNPYEKAREALRERVRKFLDK